MVILHIGYIDSSVIGGVPVAVPMMIRSQGLHATVGLFNLHGTPVPGVTTLHVDPFSLEALASPFDRPDLVIFHEVYRIAFISISKVLRRAGIPYVVIPHGCLTKQAQNRKKLKKALGNLLLFRRFLTAANAVQYLSDREAEHAVFSLPHFVLGNGVPLPGKKKTAFFEAGIQLLYIGRLEIEIKGLDLLIAAVARSRRLLEETGCRLFLYGPDDDQAHDRCRKMMAENGVEDLITLQHTITGADKEAALLSADYFIQTSRSEGMPMGLLEALSYGLPCIVTEGTGLSSIITENGAGYSGATSVDGICAAIREAIADRADIQARSAAAARLAETHFDQNAIAARAVEIYSRITAKAER